MFVGQPRKMEGYKQLIGNLPNIPRGSIIVPSNLNFNVYFGDKQSLQYFPADSSPQRVGGLVDRTPVLFPSNDNNLWQFDTLFDTTSNGNTLIAYAGNNLSSIQNTVENRIYYGDADANTALIPTGLTTSGGIVVLHPYLFIYGNDGIISWTHANDPTVLLNTARVTGKKIVYGAPTRAGNQSPGGLFWSLDSLIRGVNSGATAAEYSFDTISKGISILSSNSVVEHDSTYYWAANDRFLYYNGAVNELPNEDCLNYFFSNLNVAQRQKVWATVDAEWGEIFWYFPMINPLDRSLDAKECDSVAIYNIRKNKWYVNKLGRGCGDFDETFPFPVWAGNSVEGGGYSIWAHEVGVDKDVDGVLTAILSSIETPFFSLMAWGPDGKFYGKDKNINLLKLITDITRTGDITLEVIGRDYPDSEDKVIKTFTITNLTRKIDIHVQARLMKLKFTSNQLGGNFQWGNILLDISEGDARP